MRFQGKGEISVKLSEIHIRDPFILPFDGKYYLFGTPGKYAADSRGFYCNVSDDLKKLVGVDKML